MSTAEEDLVANDDPRRLRQHKLRLSWMPWLYFSLKPRHRGWAEAWQAEVQSELSALETVTFGQGCFIAPEARIFAEPGRPITVGARVSVAAEVYLHGPLELGDEVSVNARASLDGGRGGIRIGAGTRIAGGAQLWAFDHGTDPRAPVRSQRVRSQGIRLGEDVWVGANAGVTDGVQIGDHAVVAMGAVVTHSVPAWAIVAGVPARVIGDRRKEPTRIARPHAVAGDLGPSDPAKLDEAARRALFEGLSQLQQSGVAPAGWSVELSREEEGLRLRARLNAGAEAAPGLEISSELGVEHRSAACGPSGSDGDDA